MEETDFLGVVEEAWKKEVMGTRPDFIFRDRLKNVKTRLKLWSKERFGDHKAKIKLYKDEAMKWELEAENRTLNDDERGFWMEARKRWVEKDNEYSNMLRQKARIKWDVEGDENSKFFHSYIKRRNNKCNLRGIIVNEDGNRPIFCCDKIEKTDLEDATMLEKSFNEKEVWDAIRGCGGDKAPWPDGFNFGFIRKVWDIIKGDLLKAIAWLWDKSEISRGCNSSFVTIIPKVSDPIGLNDFWPISLIGCYYKIIAKILVKSVKKVVGNIVGDVQNTFIKGRYILDGVLITNETMEYLKKKRERGFGSKWGMWVEACLRSSSMSILVNGSPTEEFGLEIGVKQGDPLSPFLFILAAEGLNAIVNKAVEKEFLEELKHGEMDGMRYQRVSFQVLRATDWRKYETCKCLEARGGQVQSRLADWKAKTMSFGGRLTLAKSVLGSLPLLWESRVGGVGISGGGGVWHDIVRVGAKIEGFGIEFSSLCVRVLGDGVLQNVVISNDCRDRWRWLLFEDGIFTVKDLSSLIEEKFLHVESESDDQEMLWNNLVPKNVNIFVWRALKGRLPVRVKLDRRGIDLDSVLCLSCNNLAESCAHSLVSCDLAMSVWDKIYS
ncbi:RNA-directed DNA polymerase, eukaryota [Tanacetum coccineum]